MSKASAMRLFIPITKVDVEKRLVYGVATAELPDRSGEICDYASTKPYFEAWSADVSKSSGGKSLGNIRAMHGKIAAGKVTQIDFNDDAKSIEIAAKVVDDAEWNKVVEGVYTGFSQGGRYVKRWADPSNKDLIRYTAEPMEVSLVDLPCLPEATFSVIKTDLSGGAVSITEEIRKFKTVIAEPAIGEVDKRAEEILLKDATISVEAAKQAAHEALISEALAKATPSEEEPVVEAAATPADAAAVVEAEKIANGAVDETTTEPAPAEDTPVTEETPGKDPEEEAISEITASNKAAEADPNEPVQGFWDPVENQFYPTKKEAKRAIRKRLSGERIAAVTAPLDARLAELEEKLGIEKRTAPQVEKKDYSTEERKKMAEDGSAKPDGSYPIKTAADVRNAVSDFDRSKGSASDKAHIIARAKAVGAESELPSDWTKKVAETGELGKAVAAGEPNHAAIHASMTNFHASQAAKSGDKADLHKAAAGAHADAFIAHNSDAVDKAAKSDMAWGATQKCYGMGKSEGAVAGDDFPDIVAGGAIAIGKALRATVFKKLGKGLPTCARLAHLIDKLDDVFSAVTFEEEIEGDNSPLAGMLKQNIVSLCDTLKAMVAEETSELLSGPDIDFMSIGEPCEVYCASGPPRDERESLVKFLKATPALAKAGVAIEQKMLGDLEPSIAALTKAVEEISALEKKGARNNASDKGRLQKIHDLATELGADCKAKPGQAKSDEIEDLRKRLDDSEADKANLIQHQKDTETRFAEVYKRLATVENEPAAAKASIRAPETTDNVSPGPADPAAVMKAAQALLAGLPPEQRAHELTKLSLANPIPFGQRTP